MKRESLTWNKVPPSVPSLAQFLKLSFLLHRYIFFFSYAFIYFTLKGKLQIFENFGFFFFVVVNPGSFSKVLYLLWILFFKNHFLKLEFLFCQETFFHQI
jgi:hypothetical protein